MKRGNHQTRSPRNPARLITRHPYAYASDDPVNLMDPSGLDACLLGVCASQVGTRVTGFFDGFTKPVFGGTAALRTNLGLNGGLDMCSPDYQMASGIGGLDVSLEAAAIGGGYVELRLGQFLRPLSTGGVGTGPILGPLAGGAAGGEIQSLVAGNPPTAEAADKGMIGGLFGALGTGLFAVKHASGVAAAISSILGAAW